jgi:hypothetical protein
MPFPGIGFVEQAHGSYRWLSVEFVNRRPPSYMNGALMFILRMIRARRGAISASFAQNLRSFSTMVIEVLSSIQRRMQDFE